MIVFFSSEWFFFCISCLSLKILSVYPFFSQVWWFSLWPSFWTLYEVDGLSSLCIVLLPRFCLILSFGTYSSVSSFCLTLFLCSVSITYGSLFEELALCRRWHVGYRSAVPLVTRPRLSWDILCVGFVYPPVMSGLWLPWACCLGVCSQRGWWWGHWSAWLGSPPWVATTLGGAVVQAEATCWV